MQNHGPASNAEGLSTKLGQKLVSHEWCGDTLLDENNHFDTEHFTFLPDGEMNVTERQLQTDSITTVTGTSQGSRAVMNGEFYMMRGQETLRSTVTMKARASDNAECINMTVGAKSNALCPCIN